MYVNEVPLTKTVTEGSARSAQSGKTADFAAVLHNSANSQAAVAGGLTVAESGGAEFVSSMMLLNIQRQLFETTRNEGAALTSLLPGAEGTGATGLLASAPLADMSAAYAELAAKGMDASLLSALSPYWNLLYGDIFGSGNTLNGIVPIASDANLTPYIGENGFCSPLGRDWQAAVSSEFGYRTDPVYGGIAFHSGLDIAADTGTAIRVALPGTVTAVGYDGSGYGNYIIVDHGNGLSTLYAHCSAVSVAEGQLVGQGAVIGGVGSTGKSTGSHLHFEVRLNGEQTNPRGYLPQ